MAWKSGLQTLTAEEARGLISSHSTQSRLSLRKVVKFMRLIESGDWLPEEHEPIILRSSGVIRNGHHRLTAIAMVGPAQVRIQIKNA